MAQTNKLKIFNDPIYGFIGTPNELIFNLIAHPYFQRLRRISQMGLSYLVYPGAHHTRFHHALGCMHLMRKAIEILRFKQVAISQEEENALLCAILLHDIGHGPFSHALEHTLVLGHSHESLSLRLMEELNKEFNGRLTLAIQIFQNKHDKKFLNQLVSSQLDMDRLDYLRRDSFYTGVTEGNISSERLITMLNVKNNELVVEEKGLYSVEKFLMARRFMYWQVYLHKTSLAAEQLLVRILNRARELAASGVPLNISKTLEFFITREEDALLDQDALLMFTQLDDVDVLAALKGWQFHEDFILSELSKIILNRNLLKVKVKNKPFNQAKLNHKRELVKKEFNLDDSQVDYLVFTGAVGNQAYNIENENIHILSKNGKLVDVAKASDHFNLAALSEKVTKYYACYPKISV
ncbi:phosphohydrolase [Croceivirga radicis]|uniref:Phosphohydrolase n=1 Tax=Croceivirga radicis TaxID=1929488 RepID=A0A1V6LRV3_9FLAO|nr:HD domain-containing protein [Croceivirga radicis]OQD42904.1 phosphohydrolase [Croceivirga radicis]